jgi:hypothetical protein
MSQPKYFSSPIHVLRNEMSLNSIRNYSFQQFIDIFGSTKLDISDFWLISSGYDEDNNKKYVHLIIRACRVRPFFGPHLISLLPEKEGDPMRNLWVNSLTHLRRQIFNFKDRLSFERSTYIVPFKDGEVLIRLKSIRSFLHIPVQNAFSATGSGGLPRPVRRKPHVKQHLLETCMQNMITYLDREKNQTTEETLNELKTFTSNYCDHLIKFNKENV